MALGTSMALIIAAAATTAATVGTSMASSHQAEKRQSQMLEYQDEQVAKAELKQTEAESKIALSEAEATKSAADTVKKRKQAITKTVFTSPLGLSDEATVGKKSLLGG